jgi:putative serine protease PepD
VPPAAPPAPEQPAPARVSRRGPGVFAVVLIAAITALVVGTVAGLAGYLIGSSVDSSVTQGRTDIQPLPQAAGDFSPRSDGTIAGTVRAVLPSVVSIVVEGDRESGSGSGFVLRRDGFILTNNHVVDIQGKNGTLEVVLGDGTKVPGKVIGTNPSYDLAVVKIDRDDLPPLQLGNSDAVQVGDAVIAIGAPLGLEGTVTSGIVSARDRPVTAGGEGDTSYINAIQTDAAINPGNSGGPLLDGAGRVVGVNSAIASLGVLGEAGNIGLGFAIPMNSAKRIAEEIIATGKSTTPAIGVSLDREFDGPGARIADVTAGGPSDKAGLRVGDVITALKGRVIDDSTELVVAIRSFAPGDVVELEILRGGKRSTIDLTLGELKAG